MIKSQEKKATVKAAKPEVTEADPHACIRLPAHPPKRNVIAFVISLVLFLAWFGYLVIVAYFG